MKLLSLLLISATILTGCQQIDRPFYNTRNILNFETAIQEEKSDTIQAYAVSTSDINTLIVFGKEYEYILDMPSDLANILKSPLLSKLTAHIGRGDYVESTNQFTTILYLNSNQSILNEAEQKQILSLGFELESRKNEQIYKLDIKLTGKLYRANQSNQKYFAKSNYNENIRFTAHRPKSSGSKAFSLLVSPIFLAQDVMELGLLGSVFAAGYVVGAPVMLLDKLTTQEEKNK